MLLFRNIYELKELESDVSYLTAEQLEVIRQFWANFTDGATLSEEKRRFLAVWRTLGDVYHGFRARLQRQGIAYGGMMQRAAAERLLAGDFAFAERRRYVVAGFNALSACEKVLFRFLQHNAETDFYWDYDDYYLKNTDQEAGMFVRENHASFPPVVELSHDNFRKEKELTVVSTPSNAVQCKYAGRILDALRTGADGRKRPLDNVTAVVLTDENLVAAAAPCVAGGGRRHQRDDGIPDQDDPCLRLSGTGSSSCRRTGAKGGRGRRSIMSMRRVSSRIPMLRGVRRKRSSNCAGRCSPTAVSG